jgi:HlyD family secretion protein
MMNRLLSHLFLLSLIVIISACSRAPSKQSNGYIEGRYTYIATSVSGVLNQLQVEKGDSVKKDQPLFVLEQQPQHSEYLVAKDNLQQAFAARDGVNARLAYSKATFERYQFLVRNKAIEQSQLDQEQSKHDAILAELAEANANVAAKTVLVAQAKWITEQKNILAPVDAVVFDTYYRTGEYTEANKSILSLLAPENIHAIFYIKEIDLGRMKLNDPVIVSCDGCKQVYKAHVSYISPSAEYTPPVIYSSETNAKLVYRIEAKFSQQDAVHLHPGQPITISYNTHD